MMFKRRIFLLAPNYHGSTLLGRLLNGHPGVVCLADTYPSNRIDQICGCGVPVGDCRFWQTVKHRVRAARYGHHAVLLPAYPRITGGYLDRYVYNMLPPHALRALMRRADSEQFVDDYRIFLECVYAEYQARRPEVFVDGVKSIARVAALIACGVEVDGVIHLVRNAGDFAKSTMNLNRGGIPTLIRSTLGWRLYHRRARRLRRYVPFLPVSYEELADRTDETLQGIFQFVGVQPLGASELVRAANERWHFVGNNSMFNFDGRIHRRSHELTRAERSLVRLLAGPDLLATR